MLQFWPCNGYKNHWAISYFVFPAESSKDIVCFAFTTHLSSDLPHSGAQCHHIRYKRPHSLFQGRKQDSSSWPGLAWILGLHLPRCLGLTSTTEKMGMREVVRPNSHRVGVGIGPGPEQRSKQARPWALDSSFCGFSLSAIWSLPWSILSYNNLWIYAIQTQISPKTCVHPCIELLLFPCKCPHKS